MKKQISLLIVLILIDCSLGGFIGIWRGWYWTALANKDFYLWVYYIAEFSIAALLSCFIYGYTGFLANKISLDYRTLLTDKALNLNTYSEIEGGAQRVQEDCFSYPQLMIQLLMGLFKSTVMIFVFILIILMKLPIQYFIFPVIYTIIGTFLASKIASPLIKLNYINQVVEAKFRALLQKITDKQENLKVFNEVYDNNMNLFKKLKVLQYFQNFYDQITIIVPHLLLFIVYYSGKITFGIFMQVASSMTELVNNASYFINNFDIFNRFLSCRKRLKEIGVI